MCSSRRPRWNWSETQNPPTFLGVRSHRNQPTRQSRSKKLVVFVIRCGFYKIRLKYQKITPNETNTLIFFAYFYVNPIKRYDLIKPASQAIYLRVCEIPPRLSRFLTNQRAPLHLCPPLRFGCQQTGMQMAIESYKKVPQNREIYDEIANDMSLQVGNGKTDICSSQIS